MTANPHPTRRQLLHTGGAGLMTGLMTGLWTGLGLGPSGARASTPEQAWPEAFAPFAAPGFSGELRTARVPIEGRLPAALRGTLYRNGPARLQRGGQRLAHWFDGDGMVQALRFDGQGGLQHHGRLLDTPKARAEEQAGRFLYGGFGSTVVDPAPVASADAMNPGNINLLSLPAAGSSGDGAANRGKLYALWEAGSAFELDPDTLATRGAHDWSPETRRAPFGAHPRVAADGTVWNFGYMPGSGRVLVYQIAPNGRLARQTVLHLPQADMVHDFAITDRHLVFLLPPFRFERDAGAPANLMSALAWQADAPLRVAVVAMDDWRVFTTELPHGGVFHLGNAWEADGQIHLGYVQHLAMDRLLRQLQVHAPQPAAEPAPPSHWCTVQIDLQRRSARQQTSALADVEFPRWDARRTGQRTGLTVLLQRSAQAHPQVGGFDSVLVLGADGRTRRHAYGPGWIAEEHVLVPHPDQDAEDAGWVLGTAYHWPSERTTVSVFRTDRLDDGPIAQARLPYGLPLGLHGQFVPA